MHYLKIDKLDALFKVEQKSIIIEEREKNGESEVL